MISKELLAIMGLILTIIGTTFGFGIRIGTLSERINFQTKQIELLSQEVKAINGHFIEWSMIHSD